MSQLSELVRTKIYSVFSADSALNALTPGGYHHLVAPQGTVFPYVVFNQASNVPNYAFRNTLVCEEDIWQFKARVSTSALTNQSPQARAEAILTRVDQLLNGQTFSLSGATILALTRKSGIPPFAEPQSGDEMIFTHGSNYEVTTQNG